MPEFYDADGFDLDEVEDSIQYPSERYTADPVADARRLEREKWMRDAEKVRQRRRFRKLQRIQDRMNDLGASVDEGIVIALYDDDVLMLDIVPEDAYVVRFGLLGDGYHGWHVWDTNEARCVSKCDTEDDAQKIARSLMREDW